MTKITPGARLRNFREKAGLSREALARQINASAGAIQKLEMGERRLSHDWMEKIAPILGVKPADFLTQEEIEQKLTNTSKNIFVDPASITRDVPILATEQIEDADFIITNNVIDQCRRPPGIANNKTVFAIWLPTDKMEPRHLMGNLIIAESLRPATLNDDVVVEIDSRKCFIGKIVARHGDKIEIKQYNPDKNFKLDKTKIKKIYRILSTAELLGV